jgi:hypothetical protein
MSETGKRPYRIRRHGREFTLRRSGEHVTTVRVRADYTLGDWEALLVVAADRGLTPTELLENRLQDLLLTVSDEVARIQAERRSE